MESVWTESKAQQQTATTTHADYNNNKSAVGVSVSQTKNRVRAVYQALSNEDSLEIFILASFGIDASTDAWRQQGFSKKRYYQRLKRLVDIGLVQKERGQYKQSALGKLIYENQVKPLTDALAAIKFPKEQDQQIEETDEDGTEQN